jgi:acetyltransferase
MITESLVNPKSIVVVGASPETAKPGGKVLKNILSGDFAGPVYAVNPKADEVQGFAGG